MARRAGWIEEPLIRDAGNERESRLNRHMIQIAHRKVAPPPERTGQSPGEEASSATLGPAIRAGRRKPGPKRTHATRRTCISRYRFSSKTGVFSRSPPSARVEESAATSSSSARRGKSCWIRGNPLPADARWPCGSGCAARPAARHETTVALAPCIAATVFVSATVDSHPVRQQPLSRL